MLAARLELLEADKIALTQKLNAKHTFPSDYAERIVALERESDRQRNMIANLKAELAAPKPEAPPLSVPIYWGLVERDTAVWVKDDFDGPWEKRYFARLSSDGEPLFYADGKRSFEYPDPDDCDYLLRWSHHSLTEPKE